MNGLVVGATAAATVVLLACLQWLAAVLRELPAERRPRRRARAAGPRAGPVLPELRQLERLAEEALAGDRLAVARLAGLAGSAGRRCGVPLAEAEVRSVGSPAELLAAVTRWEAQVAAVRGGPTAVDG